MRVDYEDLRDFVERVLDAAGLDTFSRDAVTTGLCETSLRGVDSHGVRLLPHYAESAVTGRKNPRPKFRFAQGLPALGFLDADNAFGHAAGMKAIDNGMEMAEKTDIGAVAVANSSHPGAMASFALRAARQGSLAMASPMPTLFSCRAAAGAPTSEPIRSASPRRGSKTIPTAWTWRPA